MTNGIVKKAGKKAAEEAKKVAKQVGQELIEIPKEAAQQVVGTQIPPAPEAVQQGKVTAPVNAQQIRSQEKTRLDYLEKELQEVVRRKKLAEQQSQSALRAASPAVKPTLVEPTTRPKRGAPPGMAGKQGTKEAIKTPSG